MLKNIYRKIPNKRKLVIFDLDGTLIDSEDKLKADFIGAMTRLGIKISSEEANQEWYKVTDKHGISKKNFNKSFNQRKTWKQSLEEKEVSIFPETKQSLEELADNEVRMALLSKSTPKYTYAKLEHFDLKKYFEIIRTVHPEEQSKEKEALKIALDTNSKQPVSKFYFIGDREEDITVYKELKRKYTIDTQGIYINRDGKTLRNYTSAKNIKEANKIILGD